MFQEKTHTSAIKLCRYILELNRKALSDQLDHRCEWKAFDFHQFLKNGYFVSENGQDFSIVLE